MSGGQIIVKLLGSLIKMVFDVRTSDDYEVAWKTASDNPAERKIAEKELERRNGKK